MKANYSILDRLESISEELEMMTGLKSKVWDGKVIVDTLAGPLIYTPSEKTLMGDVYRLINHYGIKMHEWGLQNKINEHQKEINKDVVKY